MISTKCGTKQLDTSEVHYERHKRRRMYSLGLWSSVIYRYELQFKWFSGRWRNKPLS